MNCRINQRYGVWQIWPSSSGPAVLHMPPMSTRHMKPQRMTQTERQGNMEWKTERDRGRERNRWSEREMQRKKEWGKEKQRHRERRTEATFEREKEWQAERYGKTEWRKRWEKEKQRCACDHEGQRPLAASDTCHDSLLVLFNGAMPTGGVWHASTSEFRAQFYFLSVRSIECLDFKMKFTYFLPSSTIWDNFLALWVKSMLFFH